MLCDRCKKDYAETELRPLSRRMLKIWDATTWGTWGIEDVILPRTEATLTRYEANKRYCPDCFYSLNSFLRILVAIGCITAMVGSLSLLLWLSSLSTE